jgi:hypothetical protein
MGNILLGVYPVSASEMPWLRMFRCDLTVLFSPVGDILSLLVQRKYAQKARPDEAFPLRSDAIVRVQLTEHPVPDLQLDNPCLAPAGLTHNDASARRLQKGEWAVLMYWWGRLGFRVCNRFGRGSKPLCYPGGCELHRATVRRHDESRITSPGF